MAVNQENVSKPYTVDRVQSGFRIEKRLLKVLKGLAEYHDISLENLVEGIVLHAFEGKCAFGDQSLVRIGELKKIYGLDLTADVSRQLVEIEK
ncbi:hypothetical protein [Sodalis sp. RH16]|uniref:hypothetical protein n=1 Tax=Sodalis sp. RH16 TaxID=3394331 RepID=UPI0039B6A1DB